MTATAATGRGVARAMCQHSLDYARERGYRGMQFNFVVSTNTRAVALWQSFDFEIVGRLPKLSITQNLDMSMRLSCSACFMRPEHSIGRI